MSPSFSRRLQNFPLICSAESLLRTARQLTTGPGIAASFRAHFQLSSTGLVQVLFAVVTARSLGTAETLPGSHATSFKFYSNRKSPSSFMYRSSSVQFYRLFGISLTHSFPFHRCWVFTTPRSVRQDRRSSGGAMQRRPRQQRHAIIKFTNLNLSQRFLRSLLRLLSTND